MEKQALRKTMPRGGTPGGTQLGVKYCETLTGSTLTVPSSKQRFPDIACALSFKLMFKGSPGQKQTTIKTHLTVYQI